MNSDILRRRKRDVASANVNVETTLHLVAHGDKFILNVQHSKPVLHPNAPIVFVDGDVSLPWQATNLDCFMTGRLTSHDDQTVVFSYCDNLVSELQSEKIGFLGFRPGLIQDILYCHRRREEDRDRSTILVANAKALNSCAVFVLE